MSLSGALSNAISGLTANARGTSVISANIANALNEGYARRDVVLATDANQSSGGVRVVDVHRNANPVLAHEKRLALAEKAGAGVSSAFATGLERLWGSVDQPGSVAEKLVRFETAILSAAADPSASVRLRNVGHAAEAFAGALRNVSNGIAQARTDADNHIADAVDQMNRALSNIDDLNDSIMSARHQGQDTLGLMDRREAELEKLSQFVPLHVVERDSGAVAVFSSNGRTLLDTRAVEVSFEKQSAVLPHMTLGNGLLSGLRIDGKPVDVQKLQGGSLSAHFDLRDNQAVKAQATVDAIARDVIERFGPGGPDPTVATGIPGIFTDQGGIFVPASEPGLAGRIELNANLSATGSDPWRWRDGLNAPGQGDVGNSDLLLALKAQIDVPRTPGSGSLPASAVSLTSHVHNTSTAVAAERVRAIDDAGAAEQKLDIARQAVASNGVNTDQELQKLIELEKSYAANARVVRVVDDMLSELLGI
ncbi:flagellar hook-associated protein FlgK [Marivita sp. GX14005]|uniref:flagellar hook-associated protein FlgK n=1 Tax=Marivita sp. GX14005 TaxID=2942276 RepID=UPI00201A138D|nr:flagellar hook-associated protein FlgK [Marivita sp. GX14005]MCL3881758.1 flagellar hook-associated protein FlgK [Marivita sp. GX14005]